MRLALFELSAHGGLLHYTVQLADALAERGHEVDLIVPRGHELAAVPGPARRREVLFPHVRDRSAPPANRWRYQMRRAGIAVRLTMSWARCLWLIHRGRYDAVVTGTDLTTPVSAMGGVFLGRLRRRHRLAVICHNIRPFNRWGGNELYLGGRVTRALDDVYRHADVVVVHGERSRVEFEELWHARLVAIVPHGDERILAGDVVSRPAVEERVLFFGEWRKVKGIPVLMDAFDLLAARRPTARLTIAGMPAPGDFDPHVVRAWSASHGDRVEVIDRYVPVAEVPPLFARSRAVVTPYLTGYQSGVLHLAMTMGRAVVTTDVGDLATAVVDGVTGLVVPRDDPVALADAMERILADPDLAAAMGGAARQRAANEASWETAAERLEEALLAAAVPR